jgi:hypothetical protein
LYCSWRLQQLAWQLRRRQQRQQKRGSHWSTSSSLPSQTSWLLGASDAAAAMLSMHANAVAGALARLILVVAHRVLKTFE